MRVFVSSFSFGDFIGQARERGYAFADAVLPDVCAGLENELFRLPLQGADHETHPIQAGTRRQVRQRHKRFYGPIDDPLLPYGSALTRAVAELAARETGRFPELEGWLPNELGYQLYDRNGRIGAHRDRRSDKRLSLTYTILGSAFVRVYASDTEPSDYERLRQIDAYRTVPGTVMALRAPGLGSGEQVIHEVLPPEGGRRGILNVRERDTLLPPPTDLERY